MNSVLYTALLNSETKESLARMVVALRRELARRNEDARAVQALARELAARTELFATRWNGM